MNGIRNIRLIFYFLLLVVFFFVGRRAVLSVSAVAGQAASYLTYPVLLVQNKIVHPIKNYFAHRTTMEQLENELARAKEEKVALQAELIALKATADYRTDIKELLAFKKRYAADSVFIGELIFKQFSPQEHFFLVDRGSVHGIKPDMVAIYKNCLLGRVSEVYPWYCKIITLTDPRCKIAAYCKKTSTSGIHVGNYQLEQTALERVSHLCPIQEGDVILSSGEGLVFPRGFGLGRIKTCKKEELWHVIAVEPLVNLREISHCALLHKSAIS